ncbi:MAG: hypothetical protein ACOC1G_07930 [Phycisphaeraceae bacterium]
MIEPHHQNSLYDSTPPDGYREPYTDRWTPPDLAKLEGTASQHLAGCGRSAKPSRRLSPPRHAAAGSAWSARRRRTSNRRPARPRIRMRGFFHVSR